MTHTGTSKAISIRNPIPQKLNVSSAKSKEVSHFSLFNKRGIEVFKIGFVGKGGWELLLKCGMYLLRTGSAANKDQSIVNYSQSLAIDHPYLSCNDHCDQWLFQEIFFYHFQKHPFAEVPQSKCNIHRRTCVGVSSFQPHSKRDFITGDTCENRKNFTNSFFYGTTLVAALSD